jgi:hypothetical protein
LDIEEAIIYRETRNTNLRLSLLRAFDRDIRFHNPWYYYYKTAHQRITDAVQYENIRIAITPQLRLVMESGADRRRKNLPVTSEMAALIAGDAETPLYQDIVLAKRNPTPNADNSPFSTVFNVYPLYIALHYVPFFPRGDPGHSRSMTLRSEVNSRRKRLNFSI